MDAISLLVVDDDPVFSSFVCQLLRTLGDQLPCRVTCADTAEKASSEIKSNRFDLALLDYVTGQCPLAAEDSVLLFTDGLVEMPGVEGEDYGPERLLAAAHRRMSLPLAQTMDELLAEVRAFAGGNDFSDDVCLLGMEVARTGHSG